MLCGRIDCTNVHRNGAKGLCEGAKDRARERQRKYYTHKDRNELNAYAREWRQKHLQESNYRVKVFAQKRRAMLDVIKLQTGCTDCGYQQAPEALQFDHVRGNKLFNISSRVSRSWEQILNEVKKCEVRCANCHAIKTKINKESNWRVFNN